MEAKALEPNAPRQSDDPRSPVSNRWKSRIMRTRGGSAWRFQTTAGDRSPSGTKGGAHYPASRGSPRSQGRNADGEIDSTLRDRSDPELSTRLRRSCAQLGSARFGKAP